MNERLNAKRMAARKKRLEAAEQARLMREASNNQAVAIGKARRKKRRRCGCRGR